MNRDDTGRDEVRFSLSLRELAVEVIAIADDTDLPMEMPERIEELIEREGFTAEEVILEIIRTSREERA